MKQYYYRIGGCPADKDGDAECICWHSIGTGPYPGATPDNAPMLGLSGLPLQLTWRDVPDEVKSDKPKEFKREIRYEVYKRKDIDKMPPAGRKKAHALLGELNALLDGYGVRARKCVVVEADWPEYEKVWQMIEERVTGTESLSPEEVATHTHTRSKPAVARELNITLPPRVSPEEPSVTYTPPINLSKGESLKLTMPGSKEPLISIEPAQQGGDYGCKLEYAVQPDGSLRVENVKHTEQADTCPACNGTGEGTDIGECALVPCMCNGTGKLQTAAKTDYTQMPDHTGQFFRADPVKTDELQEAREELARVRAELEVFTTSVRRRESELSAELDHVKQVNAELMQGLKRLLRLGNGGTLFTAKHLDSVVNGYFGSKAELALRHAIK